MNKNYSRCIHYQRPIQYVEECNPGYLGFSANTLIDLYKQFTVLYFEEVLTCRLWIGDRISRKNDQPWFQ